MPVSKHVFENFLRPCRAVFGDAPTDDTELFFLEYDRQLEPFSAEALAKAKDAIIRTHKGPARWPKLAACVDAAVEAQDAIAVTHKTRERSSLELYYERYRKAEDRMKNEIGRRAAREGWGLGLKEFLAEKDRMPNKNEIMNIIENSRFVDRCAAGAVKMGHFHESLGGLAKSILHRRETLATRLVGEPDISDLSKRMTGERE